MCNGGCECGCAGSCNNVLCGSTGGCCGMCNTCPPPPPPTCGCGETVLSGETCINGIYYIVNTSTNQYYQFNFGYVLMTPIISDNGCCGDLSEAISMLIIIYYNLTTTSSIPPGYVLTQTIPDGATNALPGYGIAQNCFMWPGNVCAWEMNPFTSYDLVDCASIFPTEIYPNGSVSY
uniref:Uncharacterized protein n=1 Tax=viral metagenome TaxID=1070528 RepID=A0A6C0ISL9_9ZZZZ